MLVTRTIPTASWGVVTQRPKEAALEPSVALIKGNDFKDSAYPSCFLADHSVYGYSDCSPINKTCYVCRIQYREKIREEVSMMCTHVLMKQFN